MIRSIPAITLSLVTAVSAHAQTAWPDYMRALQSDVSDSPVAAALPADVKIVAPDAALRAERAAWSGNWLGWACAGQSCDIKIAVERVNETGATLVYAGASATGGIVHRGEAKFVGDELHLPMPTGNRVALRLRAGGQEMELSLTRPGGQLLSAGVLAQRLPAPQRMRTVERMATPWTHAGQPVELVLVVYKPTQGAGPWPTLVFNHGSTGEGNQPEQFAQVFTSLDVARHFTQRGWQVIFPQRRGRGGSGGLYDEGFEPDRSRYSCDPKYSLPGFDRALEDLDVVMKHVATRPDVDAKRLLVAGQSRGGMLATAYAGLHPRSAAGVINFVGGWSSEHCPHGAQVNTALFRRGAAFPKPTLWLYGSRDSFYSLAHSRANFQAFRAAGGQGRFVGYELPAGQQGHFIRAQPELWRGDVDAYVGEVAP